MLEWPLLPQQPMGGPLKEIKKSEKMETVSAEETSLAPMDNIKKDSDSLEEVKITELLEKVREAAGSIVAHAKLASAETNREALEIEVRELAECVMIASEIYRSVPSLDHAYMLTSLTSAHNSTIALIEKLKDPKVILLEIENLIKAMFLTVLKAMMLEIDKTKRELSLRCANEKSLIDDSFARMVTSIQPETQRLYDGLHENLSKALGIKSKPKT